jgi:nitrite reductase/ring-hydroxylating ferredoxin subunit
VVKNVGADLGLIMLKKAFKSICTRVELESVDFLIRQIEFKNKPTSAIIFVFDGAVYAYINHCMHMHRPLNCEEEAVFDETGKYLRCSMHGFIFEPTTGECQSPVCLGQHLQALRIEEIEGMLYFAEKHLTMMD